MKIDQIYTTYKIMPSLQLHMYRVTVVAELIIASMTPSPLTEAVNRDAPHIISACLLHDMGNIIKFDLSMYPQFLQPEGLQYWTEIKNEFIKTYGPEEHEASYKIARELQVSERTYELITSIRYIKAEENYNSADFSKKVCDYADTRVAPFGVTSLAERIEDGRRRYAARQEYQQDEPSFLKFFNFIAKMEDQIFSQCKIKPADITDQTVNPYISGLKQFDVL